MAKSSSKNEPKKLSKAGSCILLLNCLCREQASICRGSDSGLVMENSEACKGYKVRSFHDCLWTLNPVKYIRLSLDENSLQEEKVVEKIKVCFDRLRENI